MIRVPLLLSATALLAACATVPPPPASDAPPAAAAPQADADAEIAAFFEAYDQAELARSPLSKAYRGIRDADYGRWDDFSEAGQQADHDAQLAALADLRRRFGGAALGPQQKLSYQLFETMIERGDRAFAYRDNQYVFDQMNGAQSDLPAFLINIHRIDSKADAEAYIERLRGLGPAIDQNLELARARAAKGVMPPKWVYPYVIADAKNVIAGTVMVCDAPDAQGRRTGCVDHDPPLIVDLRDKVEKLDLSPLEKETLVYAGIVAMRESVIPSYKRLIAEMEAQQKRAGTDDGVWRFPNGAAYYAERLGYYTTTALDPDAVHQIGLDQVARIHGEMRGIMARVGFKGDLKAFFRQMRTDKRFYAPNTPAGRAHYLAETEKAKAAVTAKLPTWFGTLPQAPLVVKAVEPFREKSAGKAFYQRPAPDGSRPGTYYVNLYDMADMPLTELEALFYHEGLPGHHLQLAIQTELKELPPFRRFGGFTAYTEGWGLYAEKLGKDMGLYGDPYRDFGRLQLELHRAIRLVVDTGLHHKRWSREQAIRYVEENSADAPGGIVKAIERYIIYPGQANAYMIGRLKISELRARSEAALGARFDIRAFHDAVLRNGPLPLDLLEEEVGQWLLRQDAVAAR